MYGKPYLDDRSELNDMSRRDIYLKDDYFSYKTIPASKIFKKFFRRIDFYAKPITLRHKGEYKFYTNLGMYTSLIIIIIISLFSTYLFINMIFGSNFTVDSTIIYHTPNNYPVINLQDRQFPIGFALLDEDGNIFKDAKYFKFKMFTKLIDKNNPQLSAESEFDLTSCSNTGILGERYADYFCPVSLNHSVEGTNLNEQHTMLGFKVDQCPESGDITCEPENVIIDKLKTLRMKVVYDKATFDFGSKNNPIGRITDDSTEIGLSSMWTGTRIFLRDNVHRAARNPLLFWLEDTTKFIQIKDHHNFVEGCNKLNHLGQVQFVISDEYDQFQRSLFSLVDFLVQVGGSFNSLKAIGFLITAVFSYRMFYASLIRALFFFDTTPEEFKKQFKKAEKKARKNKNKSGSNHEAANYLSNNNNQVVAKSKFEDYTDMEKIKLWALNDSSASEYSENNDPEAGEGDDFSLDKRLGYDKIRGKMLDKLGYKTLKYDYKCKSIFKSLVFCQIWRTRNYLKKNRETRKLMLYYKGMEKLDQEIDIVEIVRKFRKLDVLVKLLLKKDQQLILDLKNAIYISSEEESERYLLGYTKKKVLRKHKLLQKYIDNIKSKELTSQDEKLLNILGFKDVWAMLARPAQLAKVNSNWTDRRHPVFGLSGSPKKQRRSSQKGSDSQGKGEVLRKFLEKPGKISQASSTGSEEIIPRNYYRNRKNIERRKMKKLQRGMTPEDDKVKNLNESILFCEIKNARNNTKNRNPMRMSKTRSQDKYLTLTGRRGLLSGINKEGNQKEINLTNQNKSALVEMDDIWNKMERTLKGDIESVDSPEMSLKKHQNNFSSNPNVRRLNPKFNPSINSNDEFKPDATNFRNLDNSFNSDNLIKEHPSDEERDNSREESPNLKIIKPQLALAMSSSTETINRILNKDMPKDDIYFYGNPDTPKLQFEPSGMYSEESKGIEGKESSEEVKFEAIKYNEKPRAPERFGEKLRDYLKLYTNEKKKDRSDLVMSGPNPTPLMDERFRYQDDDQSIHNIQSEEEEATNNINVSGINAYTINSRKS